MRMYFQEYDPAQIDLAEQADLIIQRTLEFGEWEDLRRITSYITEGES